MKKIIVMLSIIALLVIILGANLRSKETVSDQGPKKKCIGYTILEFGKGIDCNGDTVKLSKIRGGQILANQ
jgi:hypothetical protein